MNKRVEMTVRTTVFGSMVLLAACSPSPESQKLNAYDVEEPAASAPATNSVAQIAYSYEIGYRLDADRIAKVQSDHATLCRRLGPNRCLVLESSTSDQADEGATGTSALVVDARLAPRFMSQLDSVVSGFGGSVGERRTVAEDVTKQVIDAGAKVRAKEALAERLVALIRNADGKIGELVEAERAYAETQEELAAARTLQAALRQRVGMSRFDLRYSASEAHAALAPVRQAIASTAETIGWSLGLLITVTLAALPWAIALIGLAALWRRLGWRGPIRWWGDRRAGRLAA